MGFFYRREATGFFLKFFFKFFFGVEIKTLKKYLDKEIFTTETLDLINEEYQKDVPTKKNYLKEIFDRNISPAFNKSDINQLFKASQKSCRVILHPNLQKDINIDFEPAIYFIEPDSKGYILKDSTSKQFVSQLSKENSIVTKILNSNDISILYQKDNSEEWNNLFANGSWRGSECVIIQPLLFNENTAGFIIVQSNHFSDINAKDQLLIKHLSDIISLSIKDLDILDKTIERGKDQSRIFDLLTQINLGHSETEILNKFRNLLHYFFNYDCLTISKIDE